MHLWYTQSGWWSKIFMMSWSQCPTFSRGNASGGQGSQARFCTGILYTAWELCSTDMLVFSSVQYQRSSLKGRWANQVSLKEYSLQMSFKTEEAGWRSKVEVLFSPLNPPFFFGTPFPHYMHSDMFCKAVERRPPDIAYSWLFFHVSSEYA